MACCMRLGLQRWHGGAPPALGLPCGGGHRGGDEPRRHHHDGRPLLVRARARARARARVKVRVRVILGLGFGFAVRSRGVIEIGARRPLSGAAWAAWAAAEAALEVQGSSSGDLVRVWVRGRGTGRVGVRVSSPEISS